MSDLDLGLTRVHRSRRDRSRGGCLAVLLALIVMIGAVGVVVSRGTDLISGLFADADDYTGQGTGNVRVEVVEGDSASDIGTALEEADVVASVEAFTDAAAIDPRSTSIQPGVYALREQMSAQAALSLLVGGEALVDSSVTVPEGLTVPETIERIAEESGLSRRALSHAVTASPGDLGLPGWARGDLEGHLYPSTYRVDAKTSAADLLTQMVTQFRSEANELSLVKRAAARGRTPQEIVIIASLVQAEVSRPRDFPKVARVIYNRLDIGMPLQLDSTRDFADAVDGSDITTNDTQRDDPSRYDTYEHGGLPPGAIDSPGERALKAALDPVAGNWRYFVTVDLDSGRTLFARGYAEHRRNVDNLRAFCDDSDLC